MFSTSFLALGLAVSTALVGVVNGQGITGSPLFVGCVEDTYLPDTVADIGAFGTPEDCAQACYMDIAVYMYSVWTVVPQDINRCYCTNQAPSSAALQPGSDSSGTCNTDTQAYVYVTSSTYDLVGCRSTETAGAEVIVGSPETCLGSCLYFPYAFLQATSSGYTCACGQLGNVGPQAVNCGPDVWITYVHPPSAFVAGPTGFVKRQQREQKRMRELEMEQNRFCPAGLTACKVPGDELAFECLNVDDELESCGGCLYGEYGLDASTANPALGLDCSLLPGIAAGGVTCTAGQCQAFACEETFELAPNSTCISLL